MTMTHVMDLRNRFETLQRNWLFGSTILFTKYKGDINEKIAAMREYSVIRYERIFTHQVGKSTLYPSWV